MKVHLLYFVMSISLANCLKSFSQFRLHFRLCLGSWVEKALSLPLGGVQAGLTSISSVILFQTSQSHMKLHFVFIQLGRSLHHHRAPPVVMVLPHWDRAVQLERDGCDRGVP